MIGILYNYSLAVASLLLFLQGFFPVQQYQASEQASLPTRLNDIQLNASHLYRYEVNRIVLVVIDALRTDFVTEVNMPFLFNAYPKQGCMLSVRVESPTVTLPRIKALTTGSIPQFSDVIFNLASNEIVTDSFLHRAADAGKKIIFYGDDTWMKLYPRIFERCEGVSSFYVNDYTEVDNNVTRNAVIELGKEDWDIMVLHYLGLDHIGHIYGPSSNLVPLKLQEMDKIVERMHVASKMWNKKTLLVVTSDHGMKDSGGHGGATVGEVHVPFVSLGVPCKGDSVAQTDVPATLSVLMGLPVPANSVGRVVSNMLITYPTDRLLYVLRYSSMSLLEKTNEFDDIFEQASNFHYNYLQTNKESDANGAKKLYEECSKQASDKLIHSFIKQDALTLLVSTAVLVSCFCSTLYDFVLAKSNRKPWTRQAPMFTTTVLVFQCVLPSSVVLTSIYLFIISIYVLHYVFLILKTTLMWKVNYNINMFAICGIILHSFSLMSSSFTEEEHQVWYFFWGTFILISWLFQAHESQTLQWFFVFLELRLLRTLNQTGDKWAHLPDLSQWLLLEKNYLYLQLLFIVGLLLTWLFCFSLCRKHKSILYLSTTIMLLIFVFHTWGKQSSFLGKFIWCLIFINLSLGLSQHSYYTGSVIVNWILLCILLMRSYNVILLPAFVFTSEFLCAHVKRIDVLTVIHIWLGKTFFFMQGHSNSLASVDVASGYVGLQEYITFVVITQVLCHTYAFNVLTNLLLLRNNALQADIIWAINIILQLWILIITCVTVLIQRHHLFVWTVFAPKLLIESCHVAVLLIQILLFYCAITVRQFFVKIDVEVI